jgi:hypothetical protein
MAFMAARTGYWQRKIQIKSRKLWWDFWDKRWE